MHCVRLKTLLTSSSPPRGHASCRRSWVWLWSDWNRVPRDCCTHTRIILSTCLERRSGRKRLFSSALGRLFAGHFKVMQMRPQCCIMLLYAGHLCEKSLREVLVPLCIQLCIQQDSSDCPLLWACALSWIACKHIWGCDIPFDLWFPQVCRYRPDLEWLIMLAKMLSLNDRSWSWCSEDYCRAEIRSQNKRQLTEPENFCWDYGNSWVECLSFYLQLQGQFMWLECSVRRAVALNHYANVKNGSKSHWSPSDSMRFPSICTSLLFAFFLSCLRLVSWLAKTGWSRDRTETAGRGALYWDWNCQIQQQCPPFLAECSMFSGCSLG